MNKMLSAGDVWKITMSEKTHARLWSNTTTHVLRFMYRPWPDTPHNEIALWLIYNYTAKTDRPITTIMRDIKKGFEVIGDQRIVLMDDYDPNAFYPTMEISMYADGDATTNVVEVTRHNGKPHTCHIGFIVGQEYDCDYNEDGFYAVITKILANYLPTRDPFLSAGKKDLENATEEYKKHGYKEHKGTGRHKNHRILSPG